MRKYFTYLTLIIIVLSSVNEALAQMEVTYYKDGKAVEGNPYLPKKKKKDTLLCNVWWANSVEKFSSQYSEIEHAAIQILGEPNAMPTGGDSKTAWCVAEKEGIEIDAEAFIIVSFEEAHDKIQQIVVGENYNPGSIKEIYAIDENGKEELVYKNTPSNVKEKFRMLNIFFKTPLTYAVKKIKIVTSPIAVSGRNELDAIGIADGLDTVKAKIHLREGLRYNETPKSLGPGINTTYDEIAPLIAPDGKTVFFDRKHHPDNAGGVEDEDDIWYSELGEDSVWQKAKNIGAPLNNPFFNFVQAVTPDGNSLLLANIYKNRGQKKGVSLSYRTRTGWSQPEAQKIKKFKNKSPFVNYFLSNDSRFLLMAIENKNGYGQLDIYVSFRKADNEWEEPINLGPVINTSVQDYSPFLASDGVTLYFSSEGHAGYGNADIFMSTRLDDSWQKWSKPYNLGPVINSAKMDSKYNMPASGDYAYFSSKNNAVGLNDIFKIKLPEPIPPKPILTIAGVVKNKKTKAPIGTMVKVFDEKTGMLMATAKTDAKDGKYEFILPDDKTYRFKAAKASFFEGSDSLQVAKIEKDLVIDDRQILLAPIEVGVRIKLENVFFTTAKYDLRPESYPELDKAVKFLNDNPRLKVEIAGHTDSRGSAWRNKKLSHNRTKSVRKYLISKGIAPERLIAKGYGESDPVATNKTKEGRQLNRRVEFRILAN